MYSFAWLFRIINRNIANFHKEMLNIKAVIIKMFDEVSYKKNKYPIFT